MLLILLRRNVKNARFDRHVLLDLRVLKHGAKKEGVPVAASV